MATYVNIDGIEGGATDIRHKGWIEATYVAWSGIHRPIAANTGATWDRDTTGGRPQVGSVFFTKFIDRATPRLMIEATTGNKAHGVCIEAVKSNGNPVVSLILRDALISEYDVLTLDGGHNVETVGISFTNMEMRYFPYDSAGKALPPQSAGHNLAHAHHYSSRGANAGGEKHFHHHRVHKTDSGKIRKTDFIQSIVAPAQWGETHFGVPASVTIAQAIIESAWGARHIHNNYFGIKAHKFHGRVDYGTIATGYAPTATHEEENGKRVSKTDNFRVYRNKLDSVRDHALFLHRNHRFKKAIDVYAKTSSADDFAQELQKASYATDHDYAQKLIEQMKKFDLYQYDHGYNAISAR